MIVKIGIIRDGQLVKGKEVEQWYRSNRDILCFMFDPRDFDGMGRVPAGDLILMGPSPFLASHREEVQAWMGEGWDQYLAALPQHENPVTEFNARRAGKNQLILPGTLVLNNKKR